VEKIKPLDSDQTAALDSLTSLVQQKETAMTSVETRKSQLIARRAELLDRSEVVERELDDHNSKDWEELATERETDEVLEQMGSAAATEIRQIDAALARVEAGDYGICVKCGDVISQERLDLLPAAPLCAKCAG